MCSSLSISTSLFSSFFFNDTAPTEIYPLPLPDALPISKIAKFEGAYHGTHDWVLVSVAPAPKAAGSRKRPKPLPASAGIPPAVLKHTVVLPWNDGEACEAIIEAEAKHLAAVIVDPLLGIGGVIPPVDGFLQRLRALTERHGILLIFDEVISFRIAWGGAQERFGVRPRR